MLKVIMDRYKELKEDLQLALNTDDENLWRNTMDKMESIRTGKTVRQIRKERCAFIRERLDKFFNKK